MSVIRRLKRYILSVAGFGFLEDESPDQSKLLSELNANLQKLKSAAVKVIAHQYHVERLLSLEKQKFDDAVNRVGEAANDEELLAASELRRDACQAQVSDLETRLETARKDAVQARDQLERFKLELENITRSIKDTRFRSAAGSAQLHIEKSLLDNVSEKELIALERMKEQADITKAEAEAIAELRDALESSEGRFDI